jgi:ElaB/YqjD/DUF883 family membrane-anchored ribosome-binding protein
MSNKVDETVSRARKMSEEVDESVHEKIDMLSKKMLEQQKIIDNFVHEKPYMAIGIGVLAGVGIGALLCGLMCRHRD